MKKGQISLDLLLTLLVAIIIIASILMLITNYNQTNQELTAQLQLTQITQNASNLIASTKSLEDTNFIIKFQIEKINYTDTNNNPVNQYPKMSIIQEAGVKKLNAKINIAQGKTLDYNALLPTNLKSTIDTNATQTKGILVIKNV